ncbi:MAG: hypothetical protein ACRCYY_00425 [Trueperaceae bacterium]
MYHVKSVGGFDEKRKLHYRRIDRYLSPLAVPMKTYKGNTTRSYHRPLQDYVRVLLEVGFGIDAWQENEDIPLFLAFRAYKK